MESKMEYQDGVYFDMPEEEYFKLPCLTNSGIKDLNIEALEFWGKRNGWTEKTESDALSFGSMAHTALLEGWEVFNKRYMIKPKGMRFSTKDGKAWREEHSDFLHCKQEDYNKVKRLQSVIDVVPNYSKYFEDGKPEVTLIWTEDFEGTKIKCAARADKLGSQGIVDLKTFTNQMGKPMDVAVAMQIANYKYFTQGNWYLRGLEALKSKGFCDKIPLKFTFFFVQSDGIPNIVIREFSRHANGMENAYYRLGTIHVERAMMIYKQCIEQFGWEKPWLLESGARPLHDAELPKYIYND